MKKAIIWTSIVLVLIIIGAIAYFRYLLPKLDKDKEAMRQAEADIVAASQSSPAPAKEDETKVISIAGDVKQTPVGFGGTAIESIPLTKKQMAASPFVKEEIVNISALS